MLSEFVSKTFVREEPLQAVEQSMREISRKLDLIRKDLAQTQLPDRSSVEKIWEAINTIQGKMNRSEKLVNSYSKTQSLLVEGLVRGEVKSAKDGDWVASAEAKSGSDVVSYIASLTNIPPEAEWTRNATIRLINELKDSVGTSMTQEFGIRTDNSRTQ